MTYEEVKKERPVILFEAGKTQWVENPFCGGRPILELDREKRSCKETNFFLKNDIWKRKKW